MNRRTKMELCRSWPVEVAKVHFQQTHWYAIHLSGGCWDDEGWFFWDDYQQPPKLYWTRKRAEEQAKALRQQYKGCRVRVVKMRPEHDVDEIRSFYKSMSREL